MPQNSYVSLTSAHYYAILQKDYMYMTGGQSFLPDVDTVKTALTALERHIHGEIRLKIRHPCGRYSG